VLISWLTIIFTNFSPFADNNATTITPFFVFTLSATASLFPILELSQPFTGLMQISGACATRSRPWDPTAVSPADGGHDG
jgi:hypothetical protein